MSLLSARHLEAAKRVRTIVDLLEFRAEREPDRVAYTYLVDGESEERHLDYGTLATRARAIAAALTPRCAIGERVMLLYPPGLEFVEGLLGCLYAGLVAVPGYPPDPTRLDRSVPRLRRMAADAEAALVLTSDLVYENRASLLGHAEDLGGLPWMSTDGVPDDAGLDWKPPPANEESLALLQYTSGSTAHPKGVMIVHRNLLVTLDVIHTHGEGIEDGEERAVIWLPQFHDFGLFEGTLFPIYAREKPRVLMSPIHFLMRPVRWLEAISRYRGTVSGGPNFAYDLCVRKTTPESRAALDLSSWTVAFTGAEPVRKSTLDRFAEAFASSGFRREAFYPCYGLAEATLGISGSERHRPPRVARLRRAELEKGRAITAEPDEEDAVEVVGCGTAIRDLRLEIVDPETRLGLADGEIGEIWASAPSFGVGYWGRPDESRAVFQARIEPEGRGGFLRTGDLGFVRDGELFVTGRLKDLIVVRGRNIFPQDVEATALGAHASLRPGSGAAFAWDNGREEGLAVAHEVYATRPEDWPAVIRAIVSAIADVHGVRVSGVVLLAPGAIPKTSSGKIQRGASRAAVRDGEFEPVAQWWAPDARPAAGRA